MTERIVDVLSSKIATLTWRTVIMLLLLMGGFLWDEQVQKIEKNTALIQEVQQCMLNEFAKKSELAIVESDMVHKTEFSELKNDIKNINLAIILIKNEFGGDLKDIKFFMGRADEYMRTDQK